MVSEGDYVRDEVECPRCGGMDTELQHSDAHSDVIQNIRTCNDCPTEYVIEFGSPICREINIYDE